MSAISSNDSASTTPAQRACEPSVRPPESWKRAAAHLHTAIESPWYRHLAQLLDEVSFATHQFYRARCIRSALLPITCESVSSPIGLGSDSAPVRVRLGGRNVFLADSMQFMLEFAVRLGLTNGVYYIMPSFRREPVDSRHLFQFFHSEVEVLGGLEDVIALAEDYVLALSTHLLAHAREHIVRLAGGTDHVERLIARGRPFPRMRMANAVALVSHLRNGSHRTELGDLVLAAAGERAVIEERGDFVWVTHAPAMAVPFYQARDPGTEDALTADLLAGIGELLGAGARCTTSDELRRALREHRIERNEYQWYVDMKARYPLKTAGFGMGIERFLLWITDTTDIRNCTLLLREIAHAHAP